MEKQSILVNVSKIRLVSIRKLSTVGIIISIFAKKLISIYLILTTIILKISKITCSKTVFYYEFIII